ncbi:MAG: LysM peptidoglycan-binding domain-containing protein [Chitinophagaceae bacterium]|nr:LysM peptidoglycan-binding domain-containing protein [Chitinophagaceae bacterium]
MKRIIILLLSVFILKGRIIAQENIVHGATPDLYLIHSVAAKETWYSLGRTYNLSPKDLASYNKLSIDKPLEIAQQIKVPLTSANFEQQNVQTGNNDLVPLYHVVAEKEWMYRISVNHNKVPIENLEKWNSINRDQAKTGMKLIVGYLKTKEGNTSVAAKSSETPAAPPPAPATQSQTAPQPQTPVVAASKQVSSGNKDGGYFRAMYEEGSKSTSGVAGIFKSTSGWNDGKYYALMSNVVVGTIIKISFPQTNKSVYAKVLGELPDMKESTGLTLRISDAAASELGAVNSKFSVDIKY